MAKSEYVNYITDLLSSLGSINARAMFGGYGIYCNGLIFAIIADDELYFKTNKRNQLDFETAGSNPFTYEAKGKRIALSYWKVPESVIEDAEVLCKWAAKAV